MIEQIRSLLEEMEDWRSKHTTHDAVRSRIHDFLYDEHTGLPDLTYGEQEIEQVYLHLYSIYDTPHPTIFSHAA